MRSWRGPPVRDGARNRATGTRMIALLLGTSLAGAVDPYLSASLGASYWALGVKGTLKPGLEQALWNEEGSLLFSDTWLRVLADVEATLRTGAPEIQVTYHRDRLATYNLNIATVARQVRDMVKGFEATRFNMKDRRIPIVARLDEPARAHVDDIGQLVINPGGEHPIRLHPSRI